MTSNNLITAASFTPISLQSPNAWVGHLPFAAWVIQEVNPKLFVELGTHSGNSYFAFCQSVVEVGLSTKCYAVDTWLGDEHAGQYDNEIFVQVNAHHQERYAGFSRLLRMTFDDAATYFADASIELLHIDGLHTYKAARHDFETWLPKLAPGAVVMFHDTNVRENNFGVWQLWAELQTQYPNNLEFLHSHGLGVLQLNNAPENRKLEWLQPNSPERQRLINYFAALGARQLERYELYELKQHISNINQSLTEQDAHIARLNQVVTERENHLKQIKESTSWRITRPIRIIRSLRLPQIITSLCTDHPLNTDLHENRVKGFDAKYYLKNNLDVAKSNMDPYEHFRLYGKNEGRQPTPDHLIVRNFKRARLIRTALFVGYRRAGGVSPAIRKVLTVLRRSGLDGVKQSLIFLHTQSINTPAGFDRNNYSEWLRRYDTITDEKRASMRACIAKSPHTPLISVVMPTYNPNPEWLIEAIESVRSQIYPHWELCIADDASTDKATHAILEHYAKEDARIKVAFREQNGHISAATNSAIELINGTWMALLDHDDLLSEHALFWVAQAIITNPEAGLIYSDEDKLDQSGRRYDPYFKPDWNPDLFLSHNMICHLGIYRTDLVKSLGGFRKDYEGAQDYDLALRCTEQLKAEQIVHIPRVLYHWRSHPGSTALAGSEKNYALLAGERALNDHFDRAQITAKAELLDFGMYRAKYAIPAPAPLVSLIIPTRNGLTLLKQCIESILIKTTYKNYEIVIVNNNSDDPNTLAYFTSLAKDKRIQVIHDHRAFNYSALNNTAVTQARGEYIGLINNDIEVISPEWLDEMISLAVQPGVGAVGARLWYPDDTLQHGGCITGLGGVAGHSHKHLNKGSPGFFYRAQLIQTLSAVTAACIVVKKSIYQELGGLDEINLTVAFNDVDFCLRVREAGYRNIWTPYAELYHHESASRGHENTPEKQKRFHNEVLFIQKRWGEILKHDPAYSPNLTLAHEDFSLAWPPRVSSI